MGTARRRSDRTIRRQFVAALGAWLAAPWCAHAQKPSRVARIGFLIPAYPSSYASRVVAFRAGMRELGYVEGTDYTVDFRAAEGQYDRLPALAAELVRTKVDVIVAGGMLATRAAWQATTSTPIVMGIAGDAIAAGLVASLARPGGNITGTTYFVQEIGSKRLQLLQEAQPRISRVGSMINPANTQILGTTLQTIRMLSETLKLELPLFEVRSPAEFESAFAAMSKARVDAVEITDDPMFLGNLRAIAELAAAYRLPSTGAKEFAEAGGLLGYGVNFADVFRRAPYFVDRILKGSKPADLPVEQPTRFEFVINLKTARKLGLTLPPGVVQRADSLVE